MCKQVIETTNQKLSRLFASLDRQTGARRESLHDRDRGLLEDFLGFAASISPQDWDAILEKNAVLVANEGKLRAVYGQYIRQREQQEAARLLDQNPQGPAGSSGLMLEDFGSRIYERVHDLFDQLELSSCRRFVMVGCGPLPGTLLNVMDNTCVAHIIGLDTDKVAVSTVNRLAERFGLDRLSAVHCDGSSYDYQDADTVYVANLVQGKTKVLCRIADTVKNGTDVVLRDPSSIGTILTEAGSKDLDSRYVITGDGELTSEFWSRHVFLRVKR